MIYRETFQDIMWLEVPIAGGVFVVVLGLLAFSVVRRRAGAVAAASARSTLTPVEVGYVLVLTAFAIFLVVVTARANSQQAQAQAEPPATVIDVNAYQWCWQFQHTRAPVSVTGTCRTPQDRPTLVVPTGQPVQLRLTSRDVIHAFWVPDLAVKKDVMPDHVNTITLTLDHEGRWLGRCSEFCGQYHAMMEFYVQAVSPQQYQTYLASSGTGAPAGAAS